MEPNSSIQWSGYPALLIAGAFAGGVWAASVMETHALWGWWVGAGASGVACGALRWWEQQRLVTLAPLGRVVAILVVAVCVGGARQSLYQAPSPRGLLGVAEAVEGPVAVQGTVADAPERTPSGSRFTLSVEKVYVRGDTLRVSGQARTALRPSRWDPPAVPFPRVYQGDRLTLTGRLQRPDGLRNPGGFDYRAYLARRGTCCTLYVGQPREVHVHAAARGALTATVVAIRSHVRRQIRRYIPTDNGRAVLQALLLGDRSRVTDEQRERFARTGLLHLLAVSGLHVFLVGMVVYVLLRPLLMRVRLRWTAVELTRAVLTVAILGLYMLLTGGRPSVVRAVMMASLLIGGILLQRSAPSLNTLGLAALVLLAVRPPALFDVGFQLSMTAVAGIITLNPRLLDMMPPWILQGTVREWAVSSATVSAAAILATAPVLLYHFGWVSAAGLLLNMTGIPFTALGLTAAILTVVTGGLSSMAGAAFGSAADLFVQGLLATSRYGATWLSWAGLRMETPNLWGLAALTALLVALAQWPRPRTRWRALVGALLLVTTSVWGDVWSRRAQPTLDLVFFDVGQGGSVLLTTPAGRHVLVDTGPGSVKSAAVQYAVLPYLQRWGIDYLDAVVVTHPDEDHLGGMPTLLREVEIGRVVQNGRRADTELFSDVRRRVSRTEVDWETVVRGDVLRVDPALRVEVMWPPLSVEGRGNERNNASLVLRLTYGETSVLLPGDVERAAERALVRRSRTHLQSHLVMIPHHGSLTSSTPPFVSAVTDSVVDGYAVVSVGREQQYGMPSQAVLRRWERQGLSVHSTARSGAVWMRSDGEQVWRVQWR